MAAQREFLCFVRADAGAEERFEVQVDDRVAKGVAAVRTGEQGGAPPKFAGDRAAEFVVAQCGEGAEGVGSLPIFA